MKTWTVDDIKYLESEYQTTPIKIIAAKLNVGYDAVTHAIRRYRIVKSKEFKIRKVSGPDVCLIDPIALMESRERIGQLIMSETNLNRAKKLDAIYKSINEVISKRLVYERI